MLAGISIIDVALSLFFVVGYGKVAEQHCGQVLVGKAARNSVAAAEARHRVRAECCAVGYSQRLERIKAGKSVAFVGR